ncbi:MAG TPA: Uma2 family endonuclease [Chitinophagales bacterium]|nr:Uma2 family endonuclease [Chitinophagales bacterium]
MDTVILKTDALNMTEDEFFNFCQENEQLNLERNSQGEIIVMEPAGCYTSMFNLKLATKIEMWNEETNAGYTFESSAGFTLPNKAVRTADVAWIKKERFEAIPEEEQKKFAHICPDFVIELKSPSDSMKALKRKMNEWIENGCRLGWLVNTEEQKVYVFRIDGSIEVKSFAEKISGEDVLPGFELDLGFMSK